MEREYYSNCCEAPPLWEVYEEQLLKIAMGICMSCRDKTLFKIRKGNTNEVS